MKKIFIICLFISTLVLASSFAFAAESDVTEEQDVATEEQEVATEEQEVATEEQESNSVKSTDVYVVQRGDYLSKIAAQHKTTVAEIKELNGLTSDTILVGQKLKLSQQGKQKNGFEIVGGLGYSIFKMEQLNARMQELDSDAEARTGSLTFLGAARYWFNDYFSVGVEGETLGAKWEVDSKEASARTVNLLAALNGNFPIGNRFNLGAYGGVGFGFGGYTDGVNGYDGSGLVFKVGVEPKIEVYNALNIFGRLGYRGNNLKAQNEQVSETVYDVDFSGFEFSGGLTGKF
ncbi:MAG: LysM peptidoglycan-binding domain-containing protein [bacterium]